MRQTRKYVIYAAAVVLLAAVCLSGCDKTISTADIIGVFQEDEQTNEQVMDEEILAENTEEIAQQPVTEEQIDIDDLDEILNARVRVKKSAPRRTVQASARPKSNQRRVGHSEADDTFKMDLIDLD